MTWRKRTIMEMAREAGFHVGDQFVAGASENDLEAFAALVREDERDACLNCYSPDDTATDWADKIKARRTHD